MAESDLPLVATDIVSVGTQPGTSLEDCVRHLAGLLAEADRVHDVDALVADVMAREALGATVLPGGVAIPHARSGAVDVDSVAIAALPTALEGGARLVFLLAVPTASVDGYLEILRKVAAAVLKPEFRHACVSADDAESLATIAGRALR